MIRGDIGIIISGQNYSCVEFSVSVTWFFPHAKFIQMFHVINLHCTCNTKYYYWNICNNDFCMDCRCSGALESIFNRAWAVANPGVYDLLSIDVLMSSFIFTIKINSPNKSLILPSVTYKFPPRQKFIINVSYPIFVQFQYLLTLLSKVMITFVLCLHVLTVCTLEITWVNPGI